MTPINVSISVGELIDKITILEIKAARIRDTAKLENVHKELKLLTNTWLTSGRASAQISRQHEALKAVNEALWDIEDEIRVKEAKGQFDDRFIELARAVYINNDRRATLKREINLALGSNIIEEKSYPDYRRETNDANEAS
jgi:Family of unknown function (DUF6165)